MRDDRDHTMAAVQCACTSPGAGRTHGPTQTHTMPTNKQAPAYRLLFHNNMAKQVPERWLVTDGHTATANTVLV